MGLNGRSAKCGSESEGSTDWELPMRFGGRPPPGGVWGRGWILVGKGGLKGPRIAGRKVPKGIHDVGETDD